ncbi:hypothetical protein FA13DRAFT_1149935 [Coprinellus micaceus]|uniref:Uncharacterized protein n=1 Tax=Coprinellus micaceus TaxID=71717 RepID=A0A4Y7SV88_COPMI|nr:hypothetical protein FA13DRAFT_1149935 [Coprinellus micaceus]
MTAHRGVFLSVPSSSLRNTLDLYISTARAPPIDIPQHPATFVRLVIGLSSINGPYLGLDNRTQWSVVAPPAFIFPPSYPQVHGLFTDPPAPTSLRFNSAAPSAVHHAHSSQPQIPLNAEGVNRRTRWAPRSRSHPALCFDWPCAGCRMGFPFAILCCILSFRSERHRR